MGMGDDNNKKKNGKSMPLGINIGCLGLGGIVLLGGALVTATLVSITTRRQRRSSSDAINHLELMMKTNKDRESLDLQNSSDGANGMKEMQAKPNQILTPDETPNSGVGEDQKSAWIYIDNVFETKVVDNGYEKIVLELDYDQQSVVATQTELGFPSSEEDSSSEILAITAPRDGGGEEQKYPMLIDDEETDAAGTEKSLVSIQGVTLIKEDEAVIVEESMQYENSRDITSQGQVPLKDDAAEETPTGHVVEDQETVFMNAGAASVNRQFLEKKEVYGHDEMIPENYGDLVDKTGYPDSIVNELVMKEEAKIKVEDSLQVRFLEEEKEIDVVEDCEGDLSYKTGEVMRGEKQQTGNNSEQATGEEEEEEAVKAACVEPVNAEDVLGMAAAQQMQFHEQEKDKEGELPHVQLIEAAKVDDQPVVGEVNPPRQLIETEDELVKKEGKSKEEAIRHVRLIEEAKDGEEDGSEASSDGTRYSSMQELVIPEAKIDNQKTEENMTIVGKEQNDSDHNGIMKEGKSASNYKQRFAKQAAASEPWNLKLWGWFLLASIWCICHCYSELPLPEVSLVGSLFFIFIFLGHRKRTK